MVGLAVSQVVGATLEKSAYKTWMDIVISATMWCLSFIMINVGYEFTIDKDALGDYVLDYFIAMTAAGFPWLFVGAWFFLALNTDLDVGEALVIARFSAPTSAGILFSMLDAAGLKDTWLFQKARILAIFDDLDTILLMIPLKVILVGFKWELTVVIGIMAVLLILAWFKLHSFKLPCSWPWTLFYALVIAFLCKMLYIVTKYHIEMEEIHLEVLLPAFVLGTVIDTPCARHELEVQRRLSSIRRSTRSQMNLGAASTATKDAKATKDDVLFERRPTKDSDASIMTAKREFEDCAKGKLPMSGGPAERSVSKRSEGSIVEVEELEGSPKVVKPKKLPPLQGTAEPELPPGCVVIDTDLAASDAPCIPESALRGVAAGEDEPLSPTTPVSPKLIPDAVGPDTALRGQPNKFALPTETPNGFIAPPADQMQAGRSASKQSKQSADSKASSVSSGRSLTRYGHPRQEISAKKHHEPEAEPVPSVPAEHEAESHWEEYVQTGISMVFMVLVGLSMPALVGKNAKESGDMGVGIMILHVIVVSVLMIIGKMFPIFFYRDESPVKHRFGLCLGMCPRGEVGASIIVISLELGVKGPAIIIAMCALAINLIMSGGFIAAVKYLLRGAPSIGLDGGEQVVQSA